MVDVYDLLGLVPTYLLPPAQHWVMEAEARARANKHPFSHPDRAPEAGTPSSANSTSDLARINTAKASGHTRIDSVASDASATTVASVASASSTASRAYSSASSASPSLAESEPERSRSRSVSPSTASPPPASTRPDAGPAHVLFGHAWTEEPQSLAAADADEPAGPAGPARPARPAFTVPSYSHGTGCLAAPEHNSYPASADRTQNRQRRLRRLLPSVIRCRRCAADFAFTSQIISKGFTARNGRGYLVSPPPTNTDHNLCAEYDSDPDNMESDEAEFVKATRLRYDQRSRAKREEYHRRRRRHNLPNIAVGSYQYRSLTTGQHVIAEIVCCGCNEEVGWKYIDAREPAQKYKVGNFILEVNKVAVFHGWEDADEATVSAVDLGTERRQAEAAAVATAAATTETARPPCTATTSDADTAGSAGSAGSLEGDADSDATTDTDTADDDGPGSDDDAAVHSLPPESPAPSPQPPPPRSSFWAFRSLRAIGLADSNPLASARAMVAHRYHQHASQDDQVPPVHADPGFDAYESEVVDTIRYRMLHQEDPMLDRMHQRRQVKLQKTDGPSGQRPSFASSFQVRERRNEIPPPEIEFDSQDEDECDDLFAGTWDARIVAARRAEKARRAGRSR